MALPAIQQRPLNIQFSSQCLHIRCGVHPRQSRKFEFTRVLSMSSPGHCSSPRTVWQISVSQFRGAVYSFGDLLCASVVKSLLSCFLAPQTRTAIRSEQQALLQHAVDTFLAIHRLRDMEVHRQ
jgi:hypothetical protein